MRNAVIRKKLIKETAMIRRYFLYPQRLVVGTMPEANWPTANYQHSRLGIWAQP